MPEESSAAYLARKYHDEHWGRAPTALAGPKLSRAAQLAGKYQESHYGKMPAPTEAEAAIATAAAFLNAIDM